MKKQIGARPGREARKTAISKLTEKIKEGGITAKGQICIVCEKTIEKGLAREIPGKGFYHQELCGPLTKAWKEWREKNGEKALVETPVEKEKQTKKTSSKIKTLVEKDEFSHRKGSWNFDLDALLLKGCTTEDVEKAKIPVYRLRNHIYHLRKEHDLKIENKDGIFKIVK